MSWACVCVCVCVCKCGFQVIKCQGMIDCDRIWLGVECSKLEGRRGHAVAGRVQGQTEGLHM